MREFGLLSRGQAHQRPERPAGHEHRSVGIVHVVEAYPWDTAGLRKNATGPDPTLRFGHSALYRAAGFTRQEDTRRWVTSVGRS